MNYVEFFVGDKVYKLRLSVRATIALEKQLGMNPISIFGNGDTIPTFTVMVQILHAALQQLQHNITLDNTYDIFEKWLDEGNTATDFLPVIVDVYKVSGIIKNEEKNV